MKMNALVASGLDNDMLNGLVNNRLNQNTSWVEMKYNINGFTSKECRIQKMLNPKNVESKEYRIQRMLNSKDVESKECRRHDIIIAMKSAKLFESRRDDIMNEADQSMNQKHLSPQGRAKLAFRAQKKSSLAIS